MSTTLSQLAADLTEGRTTSEELVEACLARAADPDGEGRLVYLEIDAGAAREAARAMDGLRRAGAEPSPYAGIPVSVKDLFDLRGRRTRAGSVALDAGVAERDATAVARWRRAGLVVIGRTNMTEFAFSGLGMNPHYGTPANPWDPEARRIPGGSTSGGAVSVSDGMAHGALGSDTGGSCRIPAALCGLAGFKSTQASVPRDGMVPLSTSLDAVGVIGRSAGCCAALHSLLANEPVAAPAGDRPPRLAVVRNYFLSDAEPAVVRAFDRTLGRLGDAGAQLVDVNLAELDAIPEMNAGGGFAAAESWAWHHDLIARRAADYDPRVLSRIRRGELQTARDLIVLHERRRELKESVAKRLAGFDAFICPTVPLTAPRLDALEKDDDEYTRVNLLMLRNPTVVNLLDGCAVSVPMHEPDEPPTGLMVAAGAGQDAEVLRIGTWIEERT